MPIQILKSVLEADDKFKLVNLHLSLTPIRAAINQNFLEIELGSG